MLSTPLAVICYFLIFFVPPFENGTVVWYLFFYCAFQTLQTVSAPHRLFALRSLPFFLFCSQPLK